MHGPTGRSIDRRIWQRATPHSGAPMNTFAKIVEALTAPAQPGSALFVFACGRNTPSGFPRAPLKRPRRPDCGTRWTGAGKATVRTL